MEEQWKRTRKGYNNITRVGHLTRKASCVLRMQKRIRQASEIKNKQVLVAKQQNKNSTAADNMPQMI